MQKLSSDRMVRGAWIITAPLLITKEKIVIMTEKNRAVLNSTDNDPKNSFGNSSGDFFGLAFSYPERIAKI